MNTYFEHSAPELIFKKWQKSKAILQIGFENQAYNWFVSAILITWFSIFKPIFDLSIKSAY